MSKPKSEDEIDDEKEPLSPEEKARLALSLNERARLYPWTVFRQREIELMTGLPRIAVQRAFEAPEVKCPFGRSRPEEIMRWVEKQATKATVESVRSSRR